MTSPPAVHGPTSFNLIDPDLLFADLGLQAGSVFMDLGCGPGQYSLDAARRVGTTGRVVALDIWNRMLRNLACGAIEPLPANLLPVQADIFGPLPLRAASVDACVMAGVLHMPGRAACCADLFRETGRVLRPGGRLALVETHGSQARDLPGAPVVPNRPELTPDSLTHCARQAGFRPHVTRIQERMWWLVLAV